MPLPLRPDLSRGLCGLHGPLPLVLRVLRRGDLLPDLLQRLSLLQPEPGEQVSQRGRLEDEEAVSLGRQLYAVSLHQFQDQGRFE